MVNEAELKEQSAKLTLKALIDTEDAVNQHFFCNLGGNSGRHTHADAVVICRSESRGSALCEESHCGATVCRLCSFKVEECRDCECVTVKPVITCPRV